MKVVLFDTNFFFVKLTGRDLFDEIESLVDSVVQFVTLDKCVAELERFTRGKSKEAAGAKVALLIIKAKKFEVKKAAGKTDSAILQFAKENPRVVVATNDEVLRKQLREIEANVITLRSNGTLELN